MQSDLNDCLQSALSSLGKDRSSGNKYDEDGDCCCTYDALSVDRNKADAAEHGSYVGHTSGKLLRKESTFIQAIKLTRGDSGG